MERGKQPLNHCFRWVTQPRYRRRTIHALTQEGESEQGGDEWTERSEHRHHADIALVGRVVERDVAQRERNAGRREHGDRAQRDTLEGARTSQPEEHDDESEDHLGHLREGEGPRHAHSRAVVEDQDRQAPDRMQQHAVKKLSISFFCSL